MLLSLSSGLSGPKILPKNNEERGKEDFYTISAPLKKGG